MGQVIIDVSMSMDGFVAGPDTSDSLPLGENGERLHEWRFRQAERHGADAPLAEPPDARIVAELKARVGAVLIAWRTFDVGVRPWGDVPFPAPCFVLTHRPRGELAMTGGTPRPWRPPVRARRRRPDHVGDRGCDAVAPGHASRYRTPRP